MGHDLRFTLRQLRKSPGVTLVAVGSLALGIGASSVIFNLANLLLLRPLPVERPEELVFVYNQVPGAAYPYDLSYPDYLDYRDGEAGLRGLAAFKPRAFNLSLEDRNERIYGEIVTGNYFDLLGVDAVLGRTFLPAEDEVPGRDPVVVLSYSFWTSRLGGDPRVLGRTIRLNATDFTVVGVAPRAFSGLFFTGFRPALWVPMMMADRVTPGSGAEMIRTRDRRWLRVVGRLDKGIDVKRARAALATIASRLEAEHPESNKGVGIQVYSERQARPAPGATGILTLAVAVFMAIVGMVLLVACANVASLLLARAAARGRELAMRQALGASHGRLVRQMLTESVVLALLGGMLAVALAFWGGRVMASVELPTDIPFAVDTSPDIRSLGFVLALSLATGVGLGLVQALRLRSGLAPSLRGEGTGSLSVGVGARVLRGVVVGQVAICLVVLVAAGLFVRSMQRAGETDPGFDPDHVLLMSMDPALSGYGEAEQSRFYRQLVERVESLPEVQGATLATPLPLGLFAALVGVVVEGRTVPAEEEEVQILYSLVGPRYFETTRTPILRGHGFQNRDDMTSPPVAVVNESMAKRYWPSQSAIGKRLHLMGPLAQRHPERAVVEIVGVAADGKYRSLDEGEVAYLFLPLLQRPPMQAVSLVTRTTVDPLRAAAAVRAEARSLDPDLPIFGVQTLVEHLSGALLGARIAAAVVGTLGALGLLLATVGVYGVVSYAVSQRTRDLGIRAALGATPADTLRLVLGQGLRLTLIGIAIGALLALATTRVLSSLLHGVSATDPVVFAGVGGLLTVVGLLASAVPARRALRVDPMQLLRVE